MNREFVFSAEKEMQGFPHAKEVFLAVTALTLETLNGSFLEKDKGP